MTSPVRALWLAPAARPAPPRRVWRDWVLLGALPALVLVEAAARPEVPWRWVWAVTLAALVPTLLWRRTRPFTMLAIAFATGALVSLATGAGPEFVTTAYFLLLVYAVLRWGDGRAMLGGAALVLANVAVTFVAKSPTTGEAVGGLAVVVTTGSLGLAFRWRAASRARELDRARMLERERLARELHDTVAHHVSAIAIQAQAGAAVAGARPESAVEALRVIEGEATRTLDEMRAMVRVLRRSDAPELAPLPGLAELERLAEGPPGAAPVTIEVEGDPEGVPPAIGAAVYRIVQEAVTNARRHARGASRIAVRLGFDAGGVRLEVHDDGEPPPAPDAGFGLAGLAERAALLGGRCEAGPRAGGGWSVVAELPRAGWPA